MVTVKRKARWLLLALLLLVHPANAGLLINIDDLPLAAETTLEKSRVYAIGSSNGVRVEGIATWVVVDASTMTATTYVKVRDSLTCKGVTQSSSQLQRLLCVAGSQGNAFGWLVDVTGTKWVALLSVDRATHARLRWYDGSGASGSRVLHTERWATLRVKSVCREFWPATATGGDPCTSPDPPGTFAGVNAR